MKKVFKDYRRATSKSTVLNTKVELYRALQ